MDIITHGFPPPTTVSEAEYLASERLARRKHEFWAGTVTPMPEADLKHGVLVVRAQLRCSMQLRDRGCVALSSGMRVYIEASQTFIYPDVLIVPNPPTFYDDARDTLTDPQVIIEVVSRATSEHDRGAKLCACKGLSSLMHYVLVAEDEVDVQHHHRGADGLWRCAGLGPGDSLILESLAVEIAVGDIYRSL